VPRKLLPPAGILVVAAVAAGTSCSVGPGPPPLAPGGDAAFDRHLAELDPRYRFLFAESSRIFEARMQGAEETVLLDLGKEERSPDVEISGDLRLSPDGRWLLVPYFVRSFAYHYNRQLLLLDVRSREVRHVPIPQDEEYEFDAETSANELCHWIASDRFVISLSHYPPGGGIRKKFLGYDLADLSAQREIDFGNVYPVIRQARGSYKLLWGRSDEPTDRWTIHVFEGAGFRNATREEKEEFLELESDRPPSPNGPRVAVVDSYHNAEPLFDFEEQRSRWDIELDGRLARRTWSAPSIPLWDEDLELYTWYEYDPGTGTSYLMDGEGRYRPWHRGEWIVKFPRAPRAGAP
jgi:hypothetical protein